MFNDFNNLGDYIIANVQCIRPRLNLSDLAIFMNETNLTPEDIIISDAEKSHLDFMAKMKTFTFITFYVLAYLVGVIGNGLVIYLIYKVKKLHSITSLFLVSLASADLLLIIICVPIKVIEFLTNDWVFGGFMCKTFHYLHTFTAICSVLNLTAMSLERYFAILHPLEAKIRTTYRRAKIIILLIWVISFFAAMPVILGKKMIEVGIVAVEVCARVWCPQAWRIFEIYRTLLLLVFPFGIMAFCYIKISLELYTMTIIKKKQPQNKNLAVNDPKPSQSELDRSTENITLQTEVEGSFTKPSSEGPLLKKSPAITTGKNISFRSHSDDEATRRQIVKILMMIVGIFFVCWAPVTINNLLMAFELVERLNVGIHWYLRIVFHLLAYVNSCVNPIVYGFMSKKFREAFKKLFCSQNIDNIFVSIEMHHKQSTSQIVAINKAKQKKNDT